MNTTSIYIISAITILGVAAVVFLYRYRKRNLQNLFTQTYEMTKQVPKQKKDSFVLLMFKKSLSTSKKNPDNGAFFNKLQNPKYLEVQLLQMSNILKNPSSVKDKKTKRALKLLSNYQAWEKSKSTKDKKEAKNKAS